MSQSISAENVSLPMSGGERNVRQDNITRCSKYFNYAEKWALELLFCASSSSGGEIFWRISSPCKLRALQEKKLTSHGKSSYSSRYSLPSKIMLISVSNSNFWRAVAWNPRRLFSLFSFCFALRVAKYFTSSQTSPALPFRSSLMHKLWVESD